MISRTFHLGVAFLAIFLAGCGSTITTRIQSKPAQPVNDGMLDRAQINRGARAIERSTGINPRKSDAAVRELVRRAGTNTRRLTEAAQVALQRAHAFPMSKGQERAGFAFAACEIAFRSLRESGLPASRWLTSEATQNPLAVYNTALAVFVYEYSKRLAASPAMLSVQTPLGARIVAAGFATDSPYKAGYFDELIPADYVNITGFKKRTRVNGLGVPLVGVRKRTEAREVELSFQPPKRGVSVALGCFAEFEPRRVGGAAMSISLYDLDRTSAVRIGGSSIPLAGDFTAPLALSSDGMNDLVLGIRAILNVGASADIKGIYLIDPFDPNRIPVLLVHGLMSSPLVWRNVATAAMDRCDGESNHPEKLPILVRFLFDGHARHAVRRAHSREDRSHPQPGRSRRQLPRVDEHGGGRLQHGGNHRTNPCH